MSRLVSSRLVLSCLVLPVLSCLVLSWLVLSCLVLSCLVWSGLVWSCTVLYCLVLSCTVLFCVYLALTRIIRLVSLAPDDVLNLTRQRHSGVLITLARGIHELKVLSCLVFVYLSLVFVYLCSVVPSSSYLFLRPRPQMSLVRRFGSYKAAEIFLRTEVLSCVVLPFIRLSSVVESDLVLPCLALWRLCLCLVLS